MINNLNQCQNNFNLHQTNIKVLFQMSNKKMK